MSNLVLETKIYNLTTHGSSCSILNPDPNYKSLVEYNIPDMIVRDESIEYIQFSIPYAVIPVSFYTVNQYNNQLNIMENGILNTYVFPQGNYVLSTFITQFTSLLGSQWKISLNSFGIIFTVTNSLYSFSFYKSSTISSVMGFSTDLNSSLANGSNTLTLNRVCNFYHYLVFALDVVN